jgi:hypothetical protein
MLPHAPQLVLLVLVSTQAVPHMRMGAAQPPARHMPIWQDCPLGHMRPQAPQLAPSVIVSTHDPPQLVCVPVHIVLPAQRPIMQVCGELHRELHAPQCVFEVLMFTQSVPQRTAPVGQAGPASMPVVPASVRASAAVASLRAASRGGSTSSRAGPQAASA